MFNINLEENAGIAFEEATNSLMKVLDGEANFKNFRSYVLNLHSSLELFFKKRLYDKNEFMIFKFTKFDELLSIYERANKSNLSLFEYVETNSRKMPHTVTFIDAIKRLAFLYNDETLNHEKIEKLTKFNEIRNNITHFEFKLGDDEFVVINELFLLCESYYEEYFEWGLETSIDKELITNKNFSIRKAIYNDEFNRRLLEITFKDGGVLDDLMNFSELADSLVASGEYDNSEKSKIRERLEILLNAGFVESSWTGGEHWDVCWYHLSDLYLQFEKSGK